MISFLILLSIYAPFSWSKSNSTILSLYFINFFLIFEFNPKTHAQLFEDIGVEYDHRSVIEYVNFLRKEFNTQAVYPANIMANYEHFKEFPPDDADFRKIIKEKGDMQILSNVSNSRIVYCNEYGTWQFFESDNHGFNNPNKTSIRVVFPEPSIPITVIILP